MRVAVVLGCMALLIATTAITRGYGLGVFVSILWNACLIEWNVLQFLASYIVPHWLNYLFFWVLEYCGWFLLFASNTICFLWESGFDNVMQLLGQQPSAAGESFTQLIAHPLRASGVTALISIIGEQFMRVPQVFADFCSSFGNIPNVLLLVAFTAFQYAETRRLLGRPRLTLKEMFLTQDCLLGVIIIFVILDVAVFTLLLLKTLLHLLCIFGILALAAYVIPYFRPGTRPKHSAPCMALLSALCVIFEFHHPLHPNNSNFAHFVLSGICNSTQTYWTTGWCPSLL
jgi:hypothetical protein